MESGRASVTVGVDIGGTFTDLVAFGSGGRVWKIKVLTTPADPSVGALDSVQKLLEHPDMVPGAVRVVVHATTLASNALLTGNVPRMALVTTKGFREVLEIGRQNRPELYNLQVERLAPLVPRRYRFEVWERTSPKGEILEELDSRKTGQVARRIRRLGIGTVAVCLLHSYANPRHEKEIRKIFEKEHPDASISLSSDLLPEFREYERTSTTVVNAALRPLFSDYLAKIEKGLGTLGVRAPLFVMQSNSGTVVSTQARLEPARLIESGPVAGAVASRFYSGRTERIISLDVGGTTSKAGVWSSDRFEVTTDYEVGGRLHGTRRVEGSGYPVRFPVVDLVEVGVGGGSVAWLDAAKVLHVGPQSAGASPGPACYGKGAEQPTLTDACLALGRLSSSYLLSGDLLLDGRLAFEAIEKFVARPLGVSLVDGAFGILRIGVAGIAGALRASTVERGLDPREMSLVAFGGAGPMFACEVARELEIERVVVPPAAGLLSSMGLLLAEPLHDSVRTVLRRAGIAEPREIERVFREMEGKSMRQLKLEGVKEGEARYVRFLDLRYQGQSYELSVPLRTGPITRIAIERAVRDFHVLHESKYGYSQRDRAVEIVNVRSVARGKRGTVGKMTPGRSREKFPVSTRRVWFTGGRSVRSRVLRREGLRAGTTGEGPCVIEDYDSTLVVPPKARFIVRRDLAVAITL